MSGSHAFLKVVRQIHLYVGVFIAPSLLFFAFTGCLQVFSLHEASHESSYRPPIWLMTLAQVHKDQTIDIPKRKLQAALAPPVVSAPPASTSSAVALQAAAAPRHEEKNPLPLKIFFAFVAFGLFVSTLIGIYMSFRYTRKTSLVAALLMAGVIVPIVLALF